MQISKKQAIYEMQRITGYLAGLSDQSVEISTVGGAFVNAEHQRHPDNKSIPVSLALGRCPVGSKCSCLLLPWQQQDRRNVGRIKLKPLKTMD